MALTPIEHYLDGARAAPLARFLERHTDPVILLRAGPAGVAPPAKSFHTSFVDTHGHREAAPAAPPGVAAFPIAKRRDAVFQDRITVGRTRNADISLEDPKVSKLHAYFARASDPAAGYTLTDVGSTNGTFANNVRLGTDQPQQLKDGDLLRFGHTACVFYTPSGLHRLLSGGAASLANLPL